MPETVQSASTPEASRSPSAQALHEHLAVLPEAAALRVRTLANAWQGGGGHLHVGRLALRLLAADGPSRFFTAGTLHGAHGVPPQPTLELGRILLQAHGVSEAAWTEWCDSHPELPALGFRRDAKFPAVLLGNVGDAALARLATGLRDLARLTSKP